MPSTVTLPVKPPARTDPAIDRTTIAKLAARRKSANGSLLDRLVKIYLDQSPGHLEAIASGIDTRDAASVKFAAHTLKSSSAALGAHGFAEICQQLELQASNNDIERTAELAAVLQEQFSTVCEALAGECRHIADETTQTGGRQQPAA